MYIANIFYICNIHVSKMEKLIEYSNKRIAATDTGYLRFLHEIIDWNNRLIAITGARGVGKTTFLLQHIKMNLFHRPDEVIFVNADDLHFAKSTLIEFADEFVKRGGKYLFIDEVHKYKNWSTEIKNIYDYFSELNIVITGSSALDIFKSAADLSRRTMTYKMPGLSFREFIALSEGIQLSKLALSDILNNHLQISTDIAGKIKPIKLFREYLRYGYYPFFKESVESFPIKLKQAVNQVLESDLPAIVHIDYNSIFSLRKLLSIITEIVPFKPNISKLSQQVEVSRETLVRYLNHLNNADLLLLLQSSIKGMSRMNKPEKVYLHNPNLMFALTEKEVNIGTLRELFFYNQLQHGHNVLSSNAGDFIVDQKFTFEIGGKNKGAGQIKMVKDSFLAIDDIEIGTGNKIPLWLFGMLY